MKSICSPRHKAFLHRRPGQAIFRPDDQSDRRGAALVEFAIISPVILALVLGVVEMGTALEASNKLTSALREGGRLAAMDWTDIVPNGVTPNDKVMTDIKNFLEASGVPSDQVAISMTFAEGANQGNLFDLADPDNMNELFQISASIDYSAVSSFPAHLMSGQTLTASIVLRAGRIQLVD